jgi:hypothetical protein
LLLLRSHRRHGIFFNFFRTCPHVVMSGSFSMAPTIMMGFLT